MARATSRAVVLWGSAACALLIIGEQAPHPVLVRAGDAGSFLEHETAFDDWTVDGSFRNESAAEASARRLNAGRVCEPTRMGEPIPENTRTCLRQCQLNSNNEVVPDFFDWEAYCYATATDEEWDKECERFYCCLFGCAVFDAGKGRSICYDADAGSRVDLLNIVQMKNIQKGQRCAAEKCRGFCVRSEFGTCRELQYTRSCKASKLGLYKCDVQCNFARRRSSAGLCLAGDWCWLSGGGGGALTLSICLLALAQLLGLTRAA